MRISDWSSDVCSSDLARALGGAGFQRTAFGAPIADAAIEDRRIVEAEMPQHEPRPCRSGVRGIVADHDMAVVADAKCAHVPPKLFGVGNRGRQRIGRVAQRSEEHTSELQSLMRISYAVFCLKKKKTNEHTTKKQ